MVNSRAIQEAPSICDAFCVAGIVATATYLGYRAGIGIANDLAPMPPAGCMPRLDPHENLLMRFNMVFLNRTVPSETKRRLMYRAVIIVACTAAGCAAAQRIVVPKYQEIFQEPVRAFSGNSAVHHTPVYRA